MPFPSELVRILRFLGAGGIGVLLYYSILYTLTDLIGIWYMAAAAIAATINHSTNFVLQKFWTFSNKDKTKIRQQALKYLLLIISLFVLNLLLLHILVERAHLWYITAQMISTTILTIISYLVSRRIYAN